MGELRKELEESERLDKKKEDLEDSTDTAQTPLNTTESKATYGGMDIGIIFSRGRRNRGGIDSPPYGSDTVAIAQHDLIELGFLATSGRLTSVLYGAL